MQLYNLKENLMTPIELRIVTHPNGGYKFYTVNIVWEGIGNVTFGGRKFMLYRDAVQYCKTEFKVGTPILRD